MNNILEVIIMTILPVSELRGGIPLAFYYHLSPLTAFLLCTLVNIAMVPIAFIFLETLNKLFLRIPIYNRFFHKTLERARHRVHKSMEKYGYLGLLVVVSVPLPLFGAYTGVLGSWALDMDKKKSFAFIALGTLIAGIIVTLITYSGFRLFS